jgi:hypothetical protein
MLQQTSWETYEGGSPEAERLIFERLAGEILDVQLDQKRRNRSPEVLRAFHAKSILATEDARLEVADELPERYRVGFFHPGRSYPAVVRLSNANGGIRSDHKRDLRGAAVRVRVSDEEVHDLLMTNFPVSHARNARQFIAFAKAMAGPRLLLPFRLIFGVGPFETIRMLRNVLKGGGREVRSLATETYWSRGAVLWGDAGPVRYLLRPARGTEQGPKPGEGDPDYLRREIAARLRRGDVAFDLCLQPFVDEEHTPIEDGAVEWTEEVSPPVTVARLVIPRQDIDEGSARAVERIVEQVAYNPWNTTEEFRPLGNLNRARKVVYDAGSDHRLGLRFRERVPLRNAVAGALARGAFGLINRVRPWHRFPPRISLLNLSGFRHVLRTRNLIDTERRDAPPGARPVPRRVPEPVRTARSIDGTSNDLSDPRMGAMGAAFGRNMTPVYRPDLIGSPNPIAVSDALLKREAFIPARSLNLLAAAWIQFQVHDWVDHRRHRLGERDVVVEIPGGSKWRSRREGPEEPVMRIAGNEPLIEGDAQAGRPPVFANTISHWWDASQVYGIDHQKAAELRDGPYIRLEDGYLPVGTNGAELTGFTDNWWLGLGAMHTLFAREHNLLCDALRSEYRGWDDERVYQTARLIVSALIAKIHTIEWTPAILATETISLALNSNWSGAPKDWLTQLGIWLVDAHALRGITETTPDHHAAPYSLTEEFVTVYRMHPLIPDDYAFCRHGDGKVLGTHPFGEIQGLVADDFMRRVGLHDTLYSFGIAHPGAITLHNYPNALRNFERGNGERIDLAVVDLVRDRSRGIPRYNDFRERLHKPRIRRWEDLAEDPESVRRLKDLYKDIDMVDTMVGLFAEAPPLGFGFSDTAFRIFILMASRRLQSDRFLTVDFRPEVYSPLGMDWVARNGMTSIILRHCPELAPVLPRTASAFAPWRPIIG